eukprot:5930683-Ditylum_brightwellii.AAC.1
MSAKFAKFGLQREMYVHGVTRKVQCCLPSCVLQEEAKSKTGQLAVWGTMKAAILKGDPDCKDLVAVS